MTLHCQGWVDVGLRIPLAAAGLLLGWGSLTGDK